MKSTGFSTRSVFIGTLCLCAVTAATLNAQAGLDEGTDDAKQRRIEMLGSADTNQDSILTKAELTALLEVSFGRMDRNSNSVVNMDDAPKLGRGKYAAIVSPIIEERDTNGDKSLSYDEFSSPLLKNFVESDTDNNDMVDLSVMIEKIKSGT